MTKCGFSFILTILYISSVDANIEVTSKNPAGKILDSFIAVILLLGMKNIIKWLIFEMILPNVSTPTKISKTVSILIKTIQCLTSKNFLSITSFVNEIDI